MSTEETKTVVERHLKAIFENPAAAIDDYADDAAFFTQQGVFKGKPAIGEFISQFMGALPSDMFDNFKIEIQQVEGDVAHLVWSAEPYCLLGADTFVVRGGKIVAQTFAGYMSS